MSESLSHPLHQEAKDRLQKHHAVFNSKTEQKQNTLFPWHTPFLQKALNQMDEAILFINFQGKILFSNSSAYQMLTPYAQVEHAKTSFTNQKFWDLFPDHFFGFSMQEALAFGLCYRFIHKSFRNHDLEISTFFSCEGEPQDHGLLLIAKNITQTERLKAAAHQNARMSELGNLSATMAHEIRNALGSIRGFATLLHHDLEQTPSLQEMVGWIVEGTKRIETLVSSVLHYARPIQLQKTSSDLSVFLRKTAKLFKVDPAFPSNITLELHIPYAPILFTFDPEALESALLNILFNAIQAMPHGGTLSLSLLQLEKCCQITISDTGVGMDEKTMNRLFSLFFTTKEKGHGLGLVEAKKIIEAHDGSIEVRSILHKGSSFTIQVKST